MFSIRSGDSEFCAGINMRQIGYCFELQQHTYAVSLTQILVNSPQ